MLHLLSQWIAYHPLNSRAGLCSDTMVVFWGGLLSSVAQVEPGFDALYGYSPVAAALHAGRRGVQTLYLQEGGALAPVANKRGSSRVVQIVHGAQKGLTWWLRRHDV